MNAFVIYFILAIVLAVVSYSLLDRYTPHGTVLVVGFILLVISFISDSPGKPATSRSSEFMIGIMRLYGIVGLIIGAYYTYRGDREDKLKVVLQPNQKFTNKIRREGSPINLNKCSKCGCVNHFAALTCKNCGFLLNNKVNN